MVGVRRQGSAAVILAVVPVPALRAYVISIYGSKGAAGDWTGAQGASPPRGHVPYPPSLFLAGLPPAVGWLLMWSGLLVDPIGSAQRSEHESR